MRASPGTSDLTEQWSTPTVCNMATDVLPPPARTLGGSRGDHGGATQAALLATMARGLAAQLPLRLGQPLGAFPELPGGHGGGGAAPCSSRPVSG